MNIPLSAIGTRLANYLAEPSMQGSLVATVAPERLAAALRPGDVVFIEGSTRISVAIEYLILSTWSHTTLFVGDAPSPPRWRRGAPMPHRS